LSSMPSLECLSDKSIRLIHWVLKTRFAISLVTSPEAELECEFGGKLDKRSIASSQPQFVLRISPRVASQVDVGLTTFKTAVAEYGSIPAYHGTASENLHSILRCGLVYYSDSSLQRNGAMYGHGVYLSTDLAVALNFAEAMKDGTKSTSFGKSLRVLLLCQVCLAPSVRHSLDSSHSGRRHRERGEGMGTYVIASNLDMVRVRYLLIFSDLPKRARGSESVDVTSASTVGGGRGCTYAHGQFSAEEDVGIGQRQGDWCYFVVIAYIFVLLGMALVKWNA
jgi:hypothetical protein